MQLYKNRNNISEIEILAGNSEKLTSSLTQVMGKFNTSEHFRIFDFLKSKGLVLSSLINILLILPFYAFTSVHNLLKCGIKGVDIEGKKDVYYDLKNNPAINWRRLLYLHIKRFRYLLRHEVSKEQITALIFDDSLLEKTGKKIEKVSVVHDHVRDIYVLGFKILVCGFWDGKSFIPLDFSLHRERGSKHDKLIKQSRKATKVVKKQEELVENQAKILQNKQLILSKATLAQQQKPNKTNTNKYDQAVLAHKKAEVKYNTSYAELQQKKQVQTESSKVLKHFYSKGLLYGLNAGQRQEQYKKAVSSQSSGFERRKEADKSKIDMVISMLCRAIKHGIIPNYVLMDSWFFCYKILEKVTQLKNGTIKLVSMVKINNQKFTLCENDNDMGIKQIIKTREHKSQRCKKLKCKYIKVKSYYKGIRVNLFLVRMGRSQSWNLLLTTDLGLSFIRMMEIYQIRWSIEVFFKESKQYLNLGGCQSVNFDSQIADTTLALMQHVMLSYFKRMNYQSSFGELFKGVSQELIEIDLVKRLLVVFWELIELLCDFVGMDFMSFHKQALNNDEFMVKFIKLLPDKVLEKAA